MTGLARSPNLLTECLGFDSFAPVTLAVARAMWSFGYRWVGRYLENLTAAEVSMLHSIGFGILLITEAVVIPLSGAVGAATGIEAVNHAKNLGAPESVHLWIDDETTQGGLSDVVDYLDEKSAAIIGGDFQAGVYVGSDQPLSGTQLYSRGHITSYWRAGSMFLPEPTCNFAIWQLPPLDLAPPELGGFKIDRSTIGADEKGRSPILWWPVGN